VILAPARSVVLRLVCFRGLSTSLIHFPL
jgi:hypothetical protein